jgi:hypothetical protein
VNLHQHVAAATGPHCVTIFGKQTASRDPNESSFAHRYSIEGNLSRGVDKQSLGLMAQIEMLNHRQIASAD